MSIRPRSDTRMNSSAVVDNFFDGTTATVVVHYHYPPSASPAHFQCGSSSGPGSTGRLGDLSSRGRTPLFTFDSGNGYAVSFARSVNETDSYKVRTVYQQVISVMFQIDSGSPAMVIPLHEKAGPVATFEERIFPHPSSPTVRTISPLYGYVRGPRGDSSSPGTVRTLSVYDVLLFYSVFLAGMGGVLRRS